MVHHFLNASIINLVGAHLKIIYLCCEFHPSSIKQANDEFFYSQTFEFIRNCHHSHQLVNFLTSAGSYSDCRILRADSGWSSDFANDGVGCCVGP